MSNPFDSPRQKIARANYHIRDLEAKVEAFSDTKPYDYFVEPDTEGVNQLHKIKFTAPLPSALADAAADAVFNLRAALDHAGYAAAVASGKTRPRKATFPFAGSAADLENEIKRRCKDLPPEIVDLIRALQPHRGGNGLLWALNRLCNINKHEILTQIGVVAGDMIIHEMVIAGGPGAVPHPVWDTDKGEMVFARIAPGTHFQHDLDFDFYVVFGDVEVVGGQPAVPVLDKLVSHIERIVAFIEAKARRRAGIA